MPSRWWEEVSPDTYLYMDGDIISGEGTALGYVRRNPWSGWCYACAARYGISRGREEAMRTVETATREVAS